MSSINSVTQTADQTPDSATPEPARLDLPAGVLALAFPGAGHALRGDPRRGLLIAFGVLGLFFTGLLTGGIDAIDSKEDRLWFIGQAFVGPITFIVDGIHQRAFKAYDADALRGHLTGAGANPRPRNAAAPPPRAASPGERADTVPINGAEYRVSSPADDPIAAPPMRKGLAKVNELAALLVTLAGMLNFIAILDALIPSRPRAARSKS